MSRIWNATIATSAASLMISLGSPSVTDLFPEFHDPAGEVFGDMVLPGEGPEMVGE
jgi:hypothetical protein